MLDGVELPVNPNAEKAVVGALISGANIDVIFSEVNLQKNDFYFSEYKTMFEAIAKLYNQNKPIDFVTVHSLLREGECDITIDTLKQTVLAVPTTKNAVHYAKIVKEFSLRRQYMALANELCEMSADRSVQMSVINQRVEEILNTEDDKIVFEGSDEFMLSTFSQIAKAVESKGKIPGQATGFKAIDLKMGGLEGLVVIGARPGMGKTALAQSIAEYVAYTEKKTVLFLSLEMTKNELMMRIFASQAGVKHSAMRFGEMSDADYEKITKLMNRTENNKNLRISDNGDVTIEAVRSACRSYKRKNGNLGVVIIDYLQLMQMPESKGMTKAQQVGKISRALKVLSKELNCPIIALSQLNRANESRNDKSPTMADLRDSGAIEQDADSVLLLHRPEVYGESKKGVAEVNIAKSRHSATGKVLLKFMPEYMRFEDWVVKKDVFARGKNSAAVWDKPEDELKQIDL